MVRAWLERRLLALWYDRTRPFLPLLPLAWLYAALAALRSAAYRRGLLRSERVAVPVIVVGNLTVGGTGKTPFVIWLVERLRAAGLRPGVIARGYGASRPVKLPRRVTPEADPAEVGDEAVLVARRTGCPVCVAVDRVAAARVLAASGEVDVLVSDDGLQHYRLARDAEIVLFDARRGFGNGAPLPAGPLRESPARLATVTVAVVNGDGPFMLPGAVRMHLTASHAVRIRDGARIPLEDFRGRRVHALAGIGDPQRFFAMLRAFGMDLDAHPLPDHAPDVGRRARFDDTSPVLMTEKDAVKCDPDRAEATWHVVPVEVRLEADGEAVILNNLRMCAGLRV